MIAPSQSLGKESDKEPVTNQIVRLLVGPRPPTFSTLTDLLLLSDSHRLISNRTGINGLSAQVAWPKMIKGVAAGRTSV